MVEFEASCFPFLLLVRLHRCRRRVAELHSGGRGWFRSKAFIQHREAILDQASKTRDSRFLKNALAKVRKTTWAALIREVHSRRRSNAVDPEINPLNRVAEQEYLSSSGAVAKATPWAPFRGLLRHYEYMGMSEAELNPRTDCLRINPCPISIWTSQLP